MRWLWWAATAAALVALADAAARRSEQDFEFDDDVDAGGSVGRAPRRYVYEPHNSLCRSLVCKKREVCVLRDAFTALCASKKDILRKGDVIVTASTSAWEAPGRDDDEEDVFYDSGAREPPEPARPDRCVGCGSRGRGQFLCGSDNRTYSSLCRLDLHNCVHRARRPVTLACRGFCPCAPAAAPLAPAAAPPAPPAAPAPPRRAHRARARAPSRLDYQHYDDEWRRRKSESSHNEVLPERSTRRRPSQAGEGCALDKMANRLLDWFSVLMDEAGEIAPPEDGFPEDCKPEVRWMFMHLDTDGDGSLSAANLYSLRHDERERCLRPFLSSCGGGGGGGGAGGARGAGVSRGAWCACLRRAARPCTALARAHPDPHSGAYVPSCDSRGFYRPRQCHAALGVCWCVDAHGVELPGSRAKGEPACPGEKSVMLREQEDSGSAGAAMGAEGVEGGEGGAPDDDEDGASGDRELRY